MGSRIVFLGTAGDSIVMGKQSRASGGIYIEYDNLAMLINPGPGSVVRAKQFGISMRELDVVIVSENSLLAASDVNTVVDAMTNGGLDPKGILVCPEEVLMGNDKFHPAISKTHKNVLERIIKLQVGDRVALNDVEIRPVERKSTGIGYKITTPHYCIGYVGSSGFSKHITGQYAKCDILILNVPNTAKKSDSELNIETATAFISAVKPKLAVLTGFGVKMVESDILSVMRQIQRDSKVQTVAAKEGLTIDPKSYSANVRQKTLLT